MPWMIRARRQLTLLLREPGQALSMPMSSMAGAGVPSSAHPADEATAKHAVGEKATIEDNGWRWPD
jgi:hypothetical protein